MLFQNVEIIALLNRTVILRMETYRFRMTKLFGDNRMSREGTIDPSVALLTIMRLDF